MEQLIEMSPVPVVLNSQRTYAAYTLDGVPERIEVGNYVDEDITLCGLAHEVGHAIHATECQECKQAIASIDSGTVQNEHSEYHAHEFAVSVLGSDRLIDKYVNYTVEHCPLECSEPHYRAAQKLLAWWNKQPVLSGV